MKNCRKRQIEIDLQEGESEWWRTRLLPFTEIERWLLSQTSEVPQQRLKLGACELAVELVVELCEDFFETTNPFVVEEVFAVADSAERWRVKLPQASFVDQTDVVHVGGGQRGSCVAVGAAQRFEQSSTIFNQRFVC